MHICCAPLKSHGLNALVFLRLSLGECVRGLCSTLCHLPMKPDSPTPSTAQVPRFALGHVVVTPDVAEHFATNGINALDYLGRHASGDWGDMPPEDAALNELALARNSRLLSRYTIAGKYVWLISEADRSSTTFLFPDEY